jgi:hypothetical protein
MTRRIQQPDVESFAHAAHATARRKHANLCPRGREECRTGQKRFTEPTTSTALAIVFLLGILVGEGHLFTPVACAILATILLALKPRLRACAGGLTQQKVRSALLLGLLGFVI